jgi:peptidylprolyl isomerase
MKKVWMSGALALVLAASACAENNDGGSAAETESAAASQSTDAAETQMAALLQDDAGSSAVAMSDQPDYDFPDDAWRTVSQDRLLYIDTDHGMIVVEMAPEFAPQHVERMTTLANEHFYDYLVWHRVIDGFVAQGGGSRTNPNHRTDLPLVPGEFTIRRNPGEIEIYETQDRVINPRSNPSMARAGFWNGFPAGTQAAALASITGDGRVESWLLHCEGAAAMARTNDPDSAGSQFYITRGNAEHLNAQYTVWGRVRAGQEAVNAIAEGTAGQDPGFTPDTIRSIRVGSDPEFNGQVNVEVIDTNSEAFANWLAAQGEGENAPDVCEVEIPVRITE